MRTSLCLAGIVSVIAMVPVPPLHADVYRCVTDDGHVSYQQIAWYDNEWGYVNRMMELTALVARGLGAGLA